MPKKVEDRDISIEEVFQLMQKYPRTDWKTIFEKVIKHFELVKRVQSDPWRYYTYKRWAEEGEDAHELFKF